MAFRTRRFVALTLLMALTACGQDPADHASAGPATEAPGTASPSTGVPTPGSKITTAPLVDLDGRQLESTSADGFDLVDGSAVRLTFGDGALWGSGGCNQFGNGRYTIQGDTLRAELSGMTEMACDGALMEQDQRFADFLQHLLTITVTGDQLTLSSPDASITFVDRQVGELEGTLVDA